MFRLPDETEPAVVVEGDCLDVLRGLPAGCADSIVTDPPYGLVEPRSQSNPAGAFAPRSEEGKVRRRGGFMGKAWDSAVPGPEVWSAVLRVLKPGGYMLAMGGTRTFHRLACAIEDAGFEMRDTIFWVYGSGFPKGKGCFKPAVEPVIVARKPLGGSDTIVGNLSNLEAQLWSLLPADSAESLSASIPAGQIAELNSARSNAGSLPILLGDLSAQMGTSRFVSAVVTCLNIVWSWKDTLADACDDPNTFTTETETRQTIDWKTLKSCLSALTPQGIIRAELQAPGSRLNALPAARYLNAACLSIYSTRELSVLANAMSAGRISPQDGTEPERSPAWEPILLCRKPGPKVLELGIDACRVPTNGEALQGSTVRNDIRGGRFGAGHKPADDVPMYEADPAGRWPANLAHDGSAEVLAAFAAFGERPGAVSNGRKGKHGSCYGEFGAMPQRRGHDDTGTAARFFYAAKASKADREDGNTHPTVKPTALMRWLCKLVTPPGGLVLDPFAGSGSTGKAAVLDGFRFVGIEREPEYAAIARRRIAAAMAEPPLLAGVG